MKPVPRVTAAIIALNEAGNLAELLPQLSWADEIVVVDGGSTDASREVAADHECVVLERPFDSFARQRNHALASATGDWILSIDADERPGRRLLGELRRRVRSPRHAAYRVPIRSKIFGRTFRRSGTQDDCPVRLLRRGAGCWVGEVHEMLHVAGRVGRLGAWIEHDTQQNLHVFLRKMHRYTTLEAHARVAAGLPPRRHDRWIAPPREILRRLVFKQGFLDGPEAWAFCCLSGLYEWVLADRHRRLWLTSLSS